MRRLACCLLIALTAGCLRTSPPTATPPKDGQKLVPPQPPNGPPGDGAAPKKTPPTTGIREVIERPQVMQELQQIGVLYTAWSFEPGGRRTATDFLKSLQKDAPSIYPSIIGGYYAINPRLTAATATVIAYETQPVEGRGHYVVRRGGAVERMTTQELTAALAK